MGTDHGARIMRTCWGTKCLGYGDYVHLDIYALGQHARSLHVDYRDNWMALKGLRAAIPFA